MKTNKDHRAALLQELKDAQADLAKQKEMQTVFSTKADAAERDMDKEDHQCLVHHYQVGEYLATLRIQAIEKAIVDGELYNY